MHIQTHQQGMNLIIRMGKMHTEVQFLYIILISYYVIVIEVIYCLSLSIQYYQNAK